MSFSEVFGFFERIYCINLDARPDRWARVQQEFRRLGIADRVDRFPAVRRENGAEGCLLSHLACADQARQDGLKNVLIFEDDVQFLDVDSAILRSALAALEARPDWELFFLGGRLVHPAKPAGPHLIRSRLWAAHGYAIHRKAFAKLPQATVPVDVWYSENLISYCISPMMAVQAEDYSDIEERHVDWKRREFEKQHARLGNPSPIRYLAAKVKWHREFLKRRMRRKSSRRLR